MSNKDVIPKHCTKRGCNGDVTDAQPVYETKAHGTGGPLLRAYCNDCGKAYVGTRQAQK